MIGNPTPLLMASVVEIIIVWTAKSNLCWRAARRRRRSYVLDLRPRSAVIEFSLSE